MSEASRIEADIDVSSRARARVLPTIVCVSFILQRLIERHLEYSQLASLFNKREMENPHAERQAVLLERIVKNSVRH